MSSQYLRAYRVCDPSFINAELKFIFNLFINLGYPPEFINKAHSFAKKRFYGNTRRAPYNPDRNNILSIPYDKGLRNIKRELRSGGIEVAFNYPSTIGKTLVSNGPTNENSCGVYEISCTGCPSKYYGETGRSLDVRVKEHKRDFRCGNDNNAIFVHSRDTGDIIDWNSNNLIYKSNDYFKRRVVESAYIDSFPHMNTSLSSFKMNKVFNNIIINEIDKNKGY